MKIEVGKKYELNDGTIAECTRMHDNDPSSVDGYGYGPFVVGDMMYHQNGTFADGNTPELNVKREALTIQTGKYYRTRDGRKVGPMLYNPESVGDRFPYVCNGGYSRYTEDGGLFVDSQTSSDLISEWTTESTRDPELTSPYGDGNHPLPSLGVRDKVEFTLKDLPHVTNGYDPEIVECEGHFFKKAVDRGIETGTLKELRVKLGDVVEFVRGVDLSHPEYTEKFGGTKSSVDEFGGTQMHDDGSQGWSEECSYIFRVISRASDTPVDKWPNNGGWSNWFVSKSDGTINNSLMRGKECDVETQKLGKCKQVAYRFRIKPQPQRETVTLYGAPSKHVQWYLDQCGLDTHRITFTTTDGKPDLGSIKMEALG